MAKYKGSTVDYGYGPDATALLAELRTGTMHIGSWPTIVKYGDPVELLRIPDTSFVCIVIRRHSPGEYYGYVNKYWDVTQ